MSPSSLPPSCSLSSLLFSLSLSLHLCLRLSFLFSFSLTLSLSLAPLSLPLCVHLSLLFSFPLLSLSVSLPLSTPPLPFPPRPGLLQSPAARITLSLPLLQLLPPLPFPGLGQRKKGAGLRVGSVGDQAGCRAGLSEGESRGVGSAQERRCEVPGEERGGGVCQPFGGSPLGA